MYQKMQSVCYVFVVVDKYLEVNITVVCHVPQVFMSQVCDQL